jgi:hypothetical protein
MGHAQTDAPKVISLPNEVGEVAPSYGDGGVRSSAPVLEAMTPPSAARTPPLASEGRKARMVAARERALLC